MTSLVRFPQRESGFLRSTGGEQKMSSMVFGQGSTPLFTTISAEQLLPATKVDYAREVGDGLGSSVLMAPLNWIMRTFPEAPAIVEKRSGDTWKETVPHPLAALLRQPNPYYGGLQLAMATVLDLSFGNAYWIKIRNANGEVIQLWWVPRYMMAPRWGSDGTTFITHYEYLAGGVISRIPVDDVVHFRFGLDPRNIRLGLSPLGSLVRDVAMDDHAANFASSILKNLGVIGIIIAPETGGAGVKDALKETKAYLEEGFSGDRRGKPLALGAPTKVNLLQYNMQGLDVSPLRDVSEERVCAALGIPAAVVGFGTGLQQTKVGATMKEMRQLAWTGGLIPMQTIVSDEIDRSLLSENLWDGFDSYSPPKRRGTIRMRYDTSKVRALWEDAEAKHTRVRGDWQAGLISKGEARRETGRAATADDDRIFARPVNSVFVSPLGKEIFPPAAHPVSTDVAERPTDPPLPSTDLTDDTEE